MLGALKGALSRLIPRRRRRRSISSTESSEEEDVAPEFANLPIFDASELRANAVRSRVDGKMAYYDREFVTGRLERESSKHGVKKKFSFSLSNPFANQREGRSGEGRGRAQVQFTSNSQPSVGVTPPRKPIQQRRIFDFS
ncbi:hypothetical protein R3P38DRAFT_2810556 [Favolaschia claudopus]|uniref:Uncharacterized protein n=1 Tax=Favolaschia claudopus TaxID=2862362 RepID=A0AAV9ZBE0_9AGAR